MADPRAPYVIIRRVQRIRDENLPLRIRVLQRNAFVYCMEYMQKNTSRRPSHPAYHMKSSRSKAVRQPAYFEPIREEEPIRSASR